MALGVPALFGAAAYFAGQSLQLIGSLAYVLGGAVILKGAFAVKALGRAALRVARGLSDGDQTSSRSTLGSLVSRDTAGLSSEFAASAAVESVAENTGDSFIGPWLAFALFGLAGAYAYRAISTLDSMLGYHGRYEYLGKASARLDDLANVAPSRLAGLLLVGAAGVSGMRFRAAWSTMMRDHAATESPNAGWPMSAMAGALGVQLVKAGHYRLGDPVRPLGAEAVEKAVRLMYVVAAMGVLMTLGVLGVRLVVF